MNDNPEHFVALSYFLDQFQPFRDSAEAGMNAIQVGGLRAAMTNEKLRTTSIEAAMRH